MMDVSRRRLGLDQRGVCCGFERLFFFFKSVAAEISRTHTSLPMRRSVVEQPEGSAEIQKSETGTHTAS